MKMHYIIAVIFVIVVASVIYVSIRNKDVKNNTQPIMDKPILKQFIELNENDFINNPVWVQCHIIDYDQPWYEETDEKTFRPWDKELPVNPDYAMYLIQTTFTANNGITYTGFITPNGNAFGENDLGLVQPQIFGKDGKIVSFWMGMFKYENEKIREIYANLNLSPNDLFPIKFASTQKLSKGYVEGIINGFLLMKDDKIEVIR
jgi:hypothetical protein